MWSPLKRSQGQQLDTYFHWFLASMSSMIQQTACCYVYTSCPWPFCLQVNTGVDIGDGSPKDLSQEGIMDLYATKWWAIKLATDAVVTVLKVDQIIMAKQAGGPKPRMGDGDDD